jgi:hypothetical protein
MEKRTLQIRMNEKLACINFQCWMVANNDDMKPIKVVTIGFSPCNNSNVGPFLGLNIIIFPSPGVANCCITSFGTSYRTSPYPFVILLIVARPGCIIALVWDLVLFPRVDLCSGSLYAKCPESHLQHHYFRPASIV